MALAPIAQQLADYEQRLKDVKDTAELLKALQEETTARIKLESEQAQLPFAQLAGIKTAIGDMKLPEGVAGTLQLAAGTAGTALIRTNRRLVSLLEDVALDLIAVKPDGATILTEEQLSNAYRAKALSDYASTSWSGLSNKIQDARSIVATGPRGARVAGAILPAAAAGVYAAGFLLDTANSVAKLFKVNRSLGIFEASGEARTILCCLLQSLSSNRFRAFPATMDLAVDTEAHTFGQQVDKMKLAVEQGLTEIRRLNTIPDEDGSKAQAVDAVDDLNARVAGMKALAEALDPLTKPEGFFTVVEGLALWKAIAKRPLLLLSMRANAIQMQETRWLWPDRLVAFAEIQVIYRFLGLEGEPTLSGVLLRTSGAEPLKLGHMRPHGDSYPVSTAIYVANIMWNYWKKTGGKTIRP